MQHITLNDIKSLVNILRTCNWNEHIDITQYFQQTS